MVGTSAKIHFNCFVLLCYFIILFRHMLIYNLLCRLVLRISGNTNMLHRITSQCKILTVPEEGWFGQPKCNTPSKKPFSSVGFCLYILHFLLSLTFSLEEDALHCLSPASSMIITGLTSSPLPLSLLCTIYHFNVILHFLRLCLQEGRVTLVLGLP